MITFTTVFVILFFIFILQTVWLFIAELAGKDLDFLLIVKFLLFSMPRIVPLVLPLSVLLASIMTFGDLAENYEFAAMKSSGISLQRAMKSLTVFILFLSLAAFVFANNVIPYAEYKFVNFRTDIGKKQPALAIAEGQFSDIGIYNIKVDKKSGENGNKLTGVTIHKKGKNGGVATIIKSKRGELISSEDSNILQLVLNDGFYYEDILPKRYDQQQKKPFAKSSFKKYIINLDLSRLNNMDDGEEKIANTNTMLNVNELTYTLDSLNKTYDKDIISFADNIYQRTGIVSHKPNTLTNIQVDTASIEPVKTKKTPPADLLSLYAESGKASVLKIASSNVESTNFSIDGSNMEMQEKTKNINNHFIALYDKFVIAFACILMFFIGAPLGAIIRKGGLGLPIVFAILIFITFHFINTFGKRVAQSDGLTPFIGAWMSSFILTPLALMLTYRATNDISFTVSFDWITVPFQKLFPKKATQDEPVSNLIINLDNLVVIEDDEWKKMNDTSDSALIGIVKNAKQFKYSTDARIKALQVLDSRGITQQQLLESNSLVNLEYQKIESVYEAYGRFTKIALFSYALAFILSAVSFAKFIVIILAFANVIIFYINLYKSQQRLEEMGKLLGQKIGVPLYIALLTGFPFFIFVYFYNKSAIKEALANYNS